MEEQQIPKYYLDKIPGLYKIIYVKNVDLVLRNVMQIILSDNLYNITKESDGGLSIIYRCDVDETNDKMLQYTENPEFFDSGIEYKCFEVTTADPALNESGLLSTITTFLASNKIPILCLSTYNCNQIFYPNDQEQQLDKVIDSDPLCTVGLS